MRIEVNMSVEKSESSVFFRQCEIENKICVKKSFFRVFLKEILILFCFQSKNI